jgi:hypothetical protein
MLPNFLIIGAQRCGTTSLYRYITTNPNIVSASVKEVHYFDYNFDKGQEWYESHFDPVIGNESDQDGKITGEASPYYIFHPLVPLRVKALLPDIKLIVLLRNPVDRAISHYYHEVRMGAETLSLEDAISSEEKRMKDQHEITMTGQYSFNHQNFSYTSRGIYVDQLQRWFDIFPKNRFKIIKSEDFFSAPSKIISEVFDFLCVNDHHLSKYEQHNIGDYMPANTKIRQELTDYFKPYNEKLYSFLDVDFNW